MNNYNVRQEPGSQPDEPIITLPSEPPRQNNDRDGIKSIVGTILILLMAPLLALAITAFVFQSYEVDGPSMENTLQNKDRLIVWKFGHTLAKVSGKDYVPARGSIVIFVKKGMTDFTSGKDKQLIKRVIGLPGERIMVKDGQITVFNNEHPEGFDPDKALGIEDTISGPTENDIPTMTIGKGELFVVGDHRNNSSDSRIFGPIPTSDLVGTLSARILPLAEAKKF